MIGPKVGQFSGGLANRGDNQCPETITRPWKFADGTGWSTDPEIKVQCAKDQSGKRQILN